MQMRAFEVARLDPLKVPEQMRWLYLDKLVTFDQVEPAVVAFEKFGCAPADERSMMARRRAPIATCRSLIAYWSSGPRWARDWSIESTSATSVLASPAVAATPAIPHIRIEFWMRQRAQKQARRLEASF